MTINAKALSKAIENEIISMRRELHKCPELKMEMDETAKLIVSYLKGMGITDIRTGIGGTGIAAVIKGGQDGPCLGIRADCDGLPIEEETGLPFASKNGNMHACGHDAHTAMALGAAKIINENRDKLKGSVKMIFQPYEEGGGGAKLMIADGVLENPHVDSLIALHTGNIFNGDAVGGNICWHPTTMSFNITAFRAIFDGKGSHVSTPHLARDPIIAACSAVMQIQSLSSHDRNPSSPVLIGVTMVNGGVRNNIIPDQCVIEGSLRTNNMEEQEYLFERIGDIVRGAGIAHRVEGRLEKVSHTPGIKMDAGLRDKFAAIAPGVVGSENIYVLTEHTPSGEDFSYFSLERPGFYFYHCSKFSDKENFAHHNSRFDIDEKYLWSGSAVFAQFAFDWTEK